MTKIVIASDSFKGSATSLEVANAIEAGIKRVEDKIKVKKLPIADGGEGTVDALIQALEGDEETVKVTGPYEQPVEATFGFVKDSIAVIEMAQASGLHLKKENDSIWDATTFGTGELIQAALDKGAKEIYIGLGGSATNDAGAGMAQALGAKLQKENGEDISLGARELADVSQIDVSEMDDRLKKVPITILSDVTNPLLGEKGASAIFGPQKGATEEDVDRLDESLSKFKESVENELEGEWSEIEGAGAAGGLGFGLVAFCGAKIESGIEKILGLIELKQELEEADLVITGEGQMDGQSVGGKAPVGVAKLAKQQGVPVAAIVGSADEDLSAIYEAGIDLVIETVNKPMTLEEAIDNAPQLIERAGETVFRAYQLNK